MVYLVLSIVALATMVSCEPPVSGYNYQAPMNNYLPPSSGGSSGGHGSHGGHGHENEVPKSYEFGYSVKDAQSGNDYNRKESSDGNVVRGEYRVALPDGRLQIVTYHADWQTGFHADVRYEGEAKYPEPTRMERPRGGYKYDTPSDFAGSLTGFQGNQGVQRPSKMYLPSGFH